MKNIKQTDKGKEAFDFIVSLMISIFALYPPIKDVLEAKKWFSVDNIPLMALLTSVLFFMVIAILFLLWVYFYNNILKKQKEK